MAGVFAFFADFVQTSRYYRKLGKGNCFLRTVEDCTVQYDYIQVVQDDCIQFCDIIKARK